MLHQCFYFYFQWFKKTVSHPWVKNLLSLNGCLLPGCGFLVYFAFRLEIIEIWVPYIKIALYQIENTGTSWIGYEHKKHYQETEKVVGNTVRLRCILYGFFPSGKLYKAIGSTEILSQSCGKLEVYDKQQQNIYMYIH